MLLPRQSKLTALLFLGLYAQGIIAGVLLPFDRPIRRDAVTTMAATSPATTVAAASTISASVSASVSVTTASASSAISSTSATISTTSALPTALNTTGIITSNGTLFNTITVPDGELPLEPRVTPGWAVAGVILLITGTAYALVGIKNKLVHTFFSTAFLFAMGTSVLIEYLMPVPVSDAVQGAFVVAATCAGLLMGGTALFFKDIAECLGCLLGGFCLAMWLLTLQAGGLVRPGSAGCVVFITAFSLAGFALYFSRWTRAYGLIGSISFAGATAAVLGIDCLSRAGMKEFWAYIWALNDNLFPEGVTTYPITRGMRVESAVTVLLFLAGLVSQLRLWRMVQERRARRDEARRDAEQAQRAEEAAIGAQIEQTNSRERARWEQAYGNGRYSAADEDRVPPSPSIDSGVDGVRSEKGVRLASLRTATVAVELDGSPIEMRETVGEAGVKLPPQLPKTAAEMVISQSAADGVVTVRVAQDDIPEGQVGQAEAEAAAVGKVWVVNEDGSTRVAEGEADRKMGLKGDGPRPNVVPLPFRVPETEAEAEAEDYKEDRSSVAACADEDREQDADLAPENNVDVQVVPREPGDGPSSVKSLSQPEGNNDKRGGEVPSGESKEDLAEGKPEEDEEVEEEEVVRNDSDSLMANLDDLSSEEDERSVWDEEDCKSTKVSAKLACEEEETGETGGDEDGKNKETNPSEGGGVEPPESGAAPSTNGTGAEDAKPDSKFLSPDEAASASGSKAVSIDSMPASLTQGNLPRPFSRVAMSYRTNEWAKHLSLAETPQPENLKLNEYPAAATPESASQQPNEKAELAAPVNVVELQQTATNAAPPPKTASVARLNARASALAQLTGGLNSGILMTGPPSPPPAMPLPSPPAKTQAGPPLGHQNNNRRSNSRRLKSGQFAAAEPIAEELNSDPSTPTSAMSGSWSPHHPGELSAHTSMSSIRAPVPGVVSCTTPQSLAGKQHMLLQSRSYSSLAGVAADLAPETMHAGQASYVTDGAGNVHPLFRSGLVNSIPPNANTVPGPAAQLYSTPHLALTPADPADAADNILLSQRQALLRQSSHGSTGPILPQVTAVNSHPEAVRRSTVLPESVRQARLASFRSSVAADLQATTAVVPAYGEHHGLLLERKEAEAQRAVREREAWERTQRDFDERMRSGALMGAHRDAMRKMQGSVREA